MKQKLCSVLSALLILSIVLSLCVSAAGGTYDGYIETENTTFSVYDISVKVNGQKIKATDVNGENYIFLPSAADLSAVELSFGLSGATLLYQYSGAYGKLLTSGETVNVKSLADFNEAENRYDLKLRAVRPSQAVSSLEYRDLTLHFMKSENIGAMYLSVEDAAYSRAWVDSSPNHTNDAAKYTKVNMYLENEDATVVYNGKLTSLKGRGNTTWTRPKKPYQIKLDKKTDLLCSGNKNNKNKTWILLANSLDKTLFKNAFAYDLAAYLGLTETPEHRFVDLYFDGEYRGTYLLCEKVQINDGRVEIDELEAHNTVENEKATAQDTNSFGLTYQYNPTAMCDTDKIDGGYLLEQDSAFYAAENSWFKTSDGSTIVIKSPEFATKEQVKFISEYFNEMLLAAKNDTYNGKSVIDYIDIDSLAALYTVNEYTKNCDFCASSTFFFLPEAGNKKYEHKFYAGPAWDFDTSLGNRTELDWMRDPETLFRENQTYFKGSIVRSAIKSKAAEIEKLGSLLFSDSAIYDSDKKLSSFEMYKSTINASSKMNFTIWPFDNSPNTFALASYEENYNYTVNFLKTRHDSILPRIAKWKSADYAAVCNCIAGDHSTETVDIKPTCTQDGKYSSSCTVCKTVFAAENTIPALGHKDNDGNGYCDNCNRSMESIANCDCLCHKTGFLGFIYKIARFFWKLFGTNNSCDCGSVHY